MNLSNMIAQMIMETIGDNGFTEIQRNEMAQMLGCVPSQINYVISSRFTPEHGYIVESRRGGGGYIRISRAVSDKSVAFMAVINEIGEYLDEKTCKAHIYNLHYQKLIDPDTARLMSFALSDNSFKHLGNENREKTRASVFKQMLLALTK